MTPEEPMLDDPVAFLAFLDEVAATLDKRYAAGDHIPLWRRRIAYGVHAFRVRFEADDKWSVWQLAPEAGQVHYGIGVCVRNRSGNAHVTDVKSSAEDGMRLNGAPIPVDYWEVRPEEGVCVPFDFGAFYAWKPLRIRFESYESASFDVFIIVEVVDTPRSA
jgi:hypothetical protein